MAFALIACSSIGACNALNGSDVTFGRTEDGAADSIARGDGSGGGDADGPVGDAGLDAPGPPTCDPSKAFGAPLPVTSVNSAAEENGARLSPDELTIVLGSERGGTPNASDLYIAKRTTITSDFGTPTALPGVAAGTDVRFPSLRGDGLSLYAKVVGGGGQGLGDVFVSTRTSLFAAFGTLAPVPLINSPSDDGNPFIREDGAALYFGSTRTGATDIYRAAVGPLGIMSSPQAVAEINSVKNDTSPAVTPDDLTIYFASARDTNGAARDIYVARRTSTTMPFGTPTVVAELASPTSDDLPTWISRDGCRLYFTSDRSGNNDVWLAARP